jgi:hypothetical protein
MGFGLRSGDEGSRGLVGKMLPAGHDDAASSSAIRP